MFFNRQRFESFAVTLNHMQHPFACKTFAHSLREEKRHHGLSYHQPSDRRLFAVDKSQAHSPEALLYIDEN